MEVSSLQQYKIFLVTGVSTVRDKIDKIIGVSSITNKSICIEIIENRIDAMLECKIMNKGSQSIGEVKEKCGKIISKNIINEKPDVLVYGPILTDMLENKTTYECIIESYKKIPGHLEDEYIVKLNDASHSELIKIVEKISRKKDKVLINF